jgi:hypothetical protein
LVPAVAEGLTAGGPHIGLSTDGSPLRIVLHLFALTTAASKLFAGRLRRRAAALRRAARVAWKSAGLHDGGMVGFRLLRTDDSMG